MSLNFVTPVDLEQAMKKQLENVQTELEKSQGKLVDKMKKVMRAELLRFHESMPSSPTALKNDEAKKEISPKANGGKDKKDDLQRRPDRKLTTNPKYTFSPVNLNAKLNDSDDLQMLNNRRIGGRFQRVSLTAMADVLSNDSGTPRSPIKREGTASGFIQDPAQTAENDSYEMSGGRISARSLQREQREDESRLREVTVETQDENYAFASPHVSEPLMDTQAGEQHGQGDAKLDWVSILQNPFLEGFIVCLVILNAVWVGVELEYKLTVSEFRPEFFDWIDILFCILFSLELVLRISVFRLEFFYTTGFQWTWNYFDLLLVLSQIMELILRLCDSGAAVHKNNVNMSWLRILRILRIVRLTRIVRAVRFIEGLRTLIKCVFRGMTSTGWITLFLAMQIYTCSLAFTELLHDLRRGHELSPARSAEFDLLFGSLLKTMGTLYKSITGGVAWGIAMDLLMEFSPPLGFVFVMHVTFCILVVLNVLTGFFIQTSSLCADEDSKALLRDRVADIFGLDDGVFISDVDQDFFADRVNSPEMQTYLNHIDLHVDEAEGLFQLLDVNGDGTLDPIELISGLMRIRGSAKALDIRILMYMVTKAQEMNHAQLTSLEHKLQFIHGRLAALQMGKEDTLGES